MINQNFIIMRETAFYYCVYKYVNTKHNSYHNLLEFDSVICTVIYVHAACRVHKTLKEVDCKRPKNSED